MKVLWLALLASAAVGAVASTPVAAQQQQRVPLPQPQPQQVQQQQQQPQKPNVVFIMGDDIGWANIGVYNQGIMAGRTPDLGRLGVEGMRVTGYHSQAK